VRETESEYVHQDLVLCTALGVSSLEITCNISGSLLLCALASVTASTVCLRN
jgi:hypothetical protein